MKKWEYDTWVFPASEISNMEFINEHLDDYGRHGWELVNILHNAAKQICISIFKKETII